MRLDTRDARMKSFFSKAPPDPEPRPSAAAAIVETFASMPLEGWIAVAIIGLAIVLSRDCVIVRLRRLVHGKSSTRENAVADGRRRDYSRRRRVPR